MVDGVTWVDDSKATNPHAAASSLAAYPGRRLGRRRSAQGRGHLRTGGRTRRRARRRRSSSASTASRSSRRSRDTRPQSRCSRWTPMRLKRSWHGLSSWRPGSRVTGTSYCSPPPRHPSTSSRPMPTAGGDSPLRCESERARGAGGDDDADPAEDASPRIAAEPVLRAAAWPPASRSGRVFAPVPSEFLLIASTALLLTGFGLVMVLSATSATATAAGEPPYEAVIKQARVRRDRHPAHVHREPPADQVLEARRVAGPDRSGAVPAARLRARPRRRGQRKPQLDHDRRLPVPAGRVPQARTRAVDGLRPVPQADAAGPVAPRVHPGGARRGARDRDGAGRSRPGHRDDPRAHPARRAVLLGREAAHLHPAADRRRSASSRRSR